MNFIVRRFIALCVLSVAIASCHKASTPQPSPAERGIGVFEITVRNGSTVMLGILESRYDSMTVRMRDGNCYADRSMRTSDESAVFKCDVATGVNDLTLSFDRRDPAARSRWSGTVMRSSPESQCTAYMIDARGQRICTASQTVIVERQVTLSGTIVVRWKAPVG